MQTPGFPIEKGKFDLPKQPHLYINCCTRRFRLGSDYRSMFFFFFNSGLSNQPKTSIEILLSILVVINAKLNTADLLNHFSFLLYHPCNTMTYPGNHPFSKPSTMTREH
jgi:hypothetical protein